MSLERRFKTVEDVELVELWMQAPEGHKPELPEKTAAYLERVKLAYRWFCEHGSKKIVRNMLITHFRKTDGHYSLKTAMRDLDDAMRLFRTTSKYQTRFTAELMLDNLMERYYSASRAGKDKECALLAGKILDYLKLMDQYNKEDDARGTDYKTIIATFDLEEAGIKRTPGLKDRIEEFKRDWAKRKEGGSFNASSATDAEFEET